MIHPVRPRLASGLLVALLIAGCSSPASPSPSPIASVSASPVATPSATASPTSTPVETTQPTASPVAAAWHLVTLPQQATIATVLDVAAGSARIVAVGGAVTTGSAKAWSSADGGRTWVAESLPPDSRTPIRVVAWGDRFLVVGAGEFNCPHPFALQTWLGSAGGSWTPAPADPMFCVGGSAEVAVHDGTAVMVGIGSGDVPFAWSSTDGLHWTDRGAIRPDTLPNVVMADASGFTVFGSSPSAPWVARSSDGATWQSEALPGTGSVSVLAAFTRNGAPAAIVSSGSGIGVISRDSAGAWQAEAGEGLDPGLVGRIVAVDGGLVAVGGGETGPALWASKDGTTWRPAMLPSGSGAGTAFTSATIIGGGAVLTGQMTVDGQARGVIWSGPASLLAP
jgi:hypothetical protein